MRRTRGEGSGTRNSSPLAHHTRGTSLNIVFAAALEAATVWINCYNAFDNASPWGGFKQSGWGREKGPYGLDLFTQAKSVIIILAEPEGL